MNFFQIDKNKTVTEVVAGQGEIPLVFAIDWETLHSAFGMSRTCLDIAHHIGESIPASPVFIRDDPDNIRQYLDESPKALAVGINPSFSIQKLLDPKRRSDFLLPWTPEDYDRLLTIGANDYSTYPDTFTCDIVLSPCFNPVEYKKSDAALKQQVVIDYTAAPTRIRRSPEAIKQEKPDIIAAYIRNPTDSELYELLSTFKVLHKNYGCQFLVSTGRTTHERQAEAIKKCLGDIPGSEFYNFKKEAFGPSKSDPLENSYEEYFRRAHAIVVTNDTLSLSDAVATGLPVFLHSTADYASKLLRGEAKSEWGIHNTLLQEALIREDRLKIFTEDNLMSGWRPKYIAEWQQIGNQIVGIISTRQTAIDQKLTGKVARPGLI